MNEASTVCISGSYGFLGAAITKSFFENGIRVRCLSRYEQKFKLKYNNIEHKLINWENKQQLVDSVKGADVVLHSAGLNARDCKDSLTNALKVNVINTKNLFDAACKAQVKHFIFFSSVHVYSENLNGIYTEKNKPLSSHPYGISKLLAENVLKQESLKSSLKVTILRLANIVGISSGYDPKKENLVAYGFCHQAINNGQIKINNSNNVLRDYVGLKNLCDTINKLISDQSRRKFEIYNLSSANSLSLYELALKIMSLFDPGKGIYPKILANFLLEKKPKKLYICNEKISKNYNLNNWDLDQDILKIIQHLIKN